ncbi:MAG TPA: ribonuclease III domain-containing protein [Mycobacteriales bacterium]|nr:ribonuclease III domain-containing protein [Mycobacteriales bacterium]
MPSSSPPVALRTSATRADGAGLERICGVTFSLADLPALLDPRGLHFQRLEWLGDSILDALLAQHLRPCPSCCAGRGLDDLCSDVVLAARAKRAGLPHALDWQPSSGRLADLVEALVGAAWLLGPAAALRVASTVVHPGLTLDPVTAIPAPSNSCVGLEPDARLGSAVLEAAAALLLLRAQPDSDEGRLSTSRNRLLTGSRLVASSRRQGLLGSCTGRAHLLDHVQAAVGLVSATQGLAAGMELATTILRAAR